MFHAYRLCAVFAVFVSVFCGGAVAQTAEPTSFESALRYAYLNNPTLNAARQELMAVHEQLPQAFAGWRPTLSSDASITKTYIDGSNFGGASGSTAKDIGASINQPLFRGGSTTAEIAAARATIDAQRARLASSEQDVLLAAVTAYSEVIRDQTLLALSQNTQKIIAKELEATSDRFEVGELTKTDVSQAEARLARADSDVITAQGNLNASIATFTEIVGFMPSNLQTPDLAVTFPQTIDEAVVQAQDNNPLVVYAVNAHEASEEDIDDVYGELLPSIGAFGTWNRTFDPSPGLIDKTTTRAIGVSATIPLYQAGAVRSRVRQAKRTANQRYLEILEARQQVKQQVVSNWAAWQAAEAEIRSRQAQVDASRIAQEGVRAEAEFGSRTVLDALDADQELFEAEVALAQAQRNEIVAQYTLLSALGSLSPETLGFADVALNYDENLDDVKSRIFDMHVDRVPEDG